MYWQNFLICNAIMGPLLVVELLVAANILMEESDDEQFQVGIASFAIGFLVSYGGIIPQIWLRMQPSDAWVPTFIVAVFGIQVLGGVFMFVTGLVCMIGNMGAKR